MCIRDRVWIALATAPEGFLFGNVTYNLQLNTQYYAATGHAQAMTLAGKLAYLGDLPLAQPGNLVAPLLFVMAVLPAPPTPPLPPAFPPVPLPAVQDSASPRSNTASISV